MILEIMISFKVACPSLKDKAWFFFEIVLYFNFSDLREGVKNLFLHQNAKELLKILFKIIFVILAVNFLLKIQMRSLYNIENHKEKIYEL